jgi:hypothetical protein
MGDLTQRRHRVYFRYQAIKDRQDGMFAGEDVGAPKAAFEDVEASAPRIPSMEQIATPRQCRAVGLPEGSLLSEVYQRVKETETS